MFNDFATRKKMSTKQYWVYILHCENNSLYTGYTTDLTKRYQSHLDGTSKCKYTRSFKPIKIAQSWVFVDKSMAMRMESLIKKLPRRTKQALILNPALLFELGA